MPQDPETARALSLVHGQVCYLQLPAAEPNRAAAFYQAVFGWQAEVHHPDFEAPGLIGQWVEDRRPAPDAGPVLWLAVADMNETLELVSRPPPTARPAPWPRSPTRKATSSAWPATRRRHRRSPGIQLRAEHSPERP